MLSRLEAGEPAWGYAAGVIGTFSDGTGEVEILIVPASKTNELGGLIVYVSQRTKTIRRETVYVAKVLRKADLMEVAEDKQYKVEAGKPIQTSNVRKWLGCSAGACATASLTCIPATI